MKKKQNQGGKPKGHTNPFDGGAPPSHYSRISPSSLGILKVRFWEHGFPGTPHVRLKLDYEAPPQKTGPPLSTPAFDLKSGVERKDSNTSTLGLKTFQGGVGELKIQGWYFVVKRPSILFMVSVGAGPRGTWWSKTGNSFLFKKSPTPVRNMRAGPDLWKRRPCCLPGPKEKNWVGGGGKGPNGVCFLFDRGGRDVGGGLKRGEQACHKKKAPKTRGQQAPNQKKRWPMPGSN